MDLIEKRYFSVFNVFYANLETRFYNGKENLIVKVIYISTSFRDFLTIIKIIYLTQILFEIENWMVIRQCLEFWINFISHILVSNIIRQQFRICLRCAFSMRFQCHILQDSLQILPFWLWRIYYSLFTYQWSRLGEGKLKVSPRWWVSFWHTILRHSVHTLRYALLCNKNHEWRSLLTFHELGKSYITNLD